ncbi:MAG: hypothetical protein JKY45_10735, partial [Emcibacter sp.]|nr:hypothetical protein [Emcibacter sp.]
LQQEELVGRIVLALLHQDPKKGEEPLLPTTLDRIVADLEKVRHARGWLKETSRIVADRFKGVGQKNAHRSHTLDPKDYKPQVSRPDIRPELRLRYDGDDQWTLIIDIPSFKAIAAISSEIRRFLRKTRCRLNGDLGKKPAGWVLSGRRRAVLKTWPDPTKPLLEFEDSDSAVTPLLESECRMSGGPIWLFRMGRDGVAREIASRIVRPGYEYILAAHKSFDCLLDGMRACSIGCRNIQAIRMSVPDDVSTEYLLWLRQQNLELARTVRVWPVGLSGRNWDGEGRSEWLTTEKPCFGIVSDHPVDSFEITLFGDSSTIINAEAVGQPIFFQLPELEPGKHVLTVRANRNTLFEELETPPAHEGYLELRVREPEPWIPMSTSHVGLLVRGDPHDASLDTFWENEFDLTVLGPEGRQVTPFVSLENAKGDEIFHARVCPDMELPIEPNIWKKRFSEFLQRERCEWKYLEALSGFLRIEGYELGQFVLRFEHELLPVRWVLRNNEDRISVRFVNDTEQEDVEPKCRFYSMETPTRVEHLDISEAIEGIEVSPSGGLYVGQTGNSYDSVIVSAGLSGDGLKGLGVQPNFGHISDDPNDIVRLLRILRLWNSARFAGFLANARRRQVISGLRTNIYGVLAGWDWARAETSFMDQKPQCGLSKFQAILGHSTGFAVVLRRDAANVENNRKSTSDWYADLARRYKVCTDAKLCAFAVDFAHDPHQVLHIYQKELPILLAGLLKKPFLLKGARFATLVSASAEGIVDRTARRWD